MKNVPQETIELIQELSGRCKGSSLSPFNMYILMYMYTFIHTHACHKQYVRMCIDSLFMYMCVKELVWATFLSLTIVSTRFTMMIASIENDKSYGFSEEPIMWRVANKGLIDPR